MRTKNDWNELRRTDPLRAMREALTLHAYRGEDDCPHVGSLSKASKLPNFYVGIGKAATTVMQQRIDGEGIDDQDDAMAYIPFNVSQVIDAYADQFELNRLPGAPSRKTTTEAMKRGEACWKTYQSSRGYAYEDGKKRALSGHERLKMAAEAKGIHPIGAEDGREFAVNGVNKFVLDTNRMTTAMQDEDVEFFGGKAPRKKPIIIRNTEAVR